MSGKQRAVLWLGIILIALNLVKNWSQISSIIFTGSSAAPSSGGSGGSSSTPGIGGLPFPFNDIPGFLTSNNTPATNQVAPL